MKRILCLSLVLCLSLSILTGCGNNEFQQRIYDAASNADSQNSAETESAVQKAVKDLLAQYQDTAESDEEAALLSRTVSLSPEALAELEDTVNALTISYPYSDLFGIEAAYQRYQALPDYQGAVEHDIVTNLPLAPERLFELVKANNAAYLEENPNMKNFQLEDAYIYWACEIICYTLNRELLTPPELPGSVIDGCRSLCYDTFDYNS